MVEGVGGVFMRMVDRVIPGNEPRFYGKGIFLWVIAVFNNVSK